MSGNRQQRRSAGRTSGGPARTARSTQSARSSRYGSQVSRNALAPGLLGGIVLLAGLALIGGTAFVIIDYATTVLALILAVYAVQARHWWWLPLLGAIAVLWNPFVQFGFHGQLWLAAQVVAAAALVVAGLLIKRVEPR